MENFRLKVFRTLAATLSFRKAAEALYLTQPAVTLQIRALEDELGVQLFDRSGKQIRLTEAGTVLLRHAREIAAVVDEAQRELGSLKGEQQGTLAVGASTTVAQYVLPHLLADFIRSCPGITMSVVGANTDRIVDLLVRGEIAVGIIEGPPMRRDVKTERFLADEIATIMPADHKWANESVSIEQLADARLILREQGSGTRRVVESALRRAGLRVRSANVVMALDSTEAIKSAVEAGLGVGFVPRRAIHKEIRLKTLCEVNVHGLTIERNFSIVLPRVPEPDGPAGAFLRFLRSVKTSESTR